MPPKVIIDETLYARMTQVRQRGVMNALASLRGSKVLVNTTKRPKETLETFLQRRRWKLGSDQNAAVKECLERLSHFNISDMYLKYVRELLDSNLPSKKGTRVTNGVADVRPYRFTNGCGVKVTVYIERRMTPVVAKGMLRVVEPTVEPSGGTVTAASHSVLPFPHGVFIYDSAESRTTAYLYTGPGSHDIDTTRGYDITSLCPSGPGVVWWLHYSGQRPGFDFTRCPLVKIGMSDELKAKVGEVLVGVPAGNQTRPSDSSGPRMALTCAAVAAIGAVLSISAFL